MKHLERFIELDVWRGMAILGMIFFHLIFLIDYFQIQQIAYSQGGWHILARLVQWSFLLLVGIGLQLSWQRTVLLKQSKIQFLSKNLSRGMIVFCCGLIVTLATAILVPDEFIRFGVLHLIGVSILFLSFIADRPRLSLALSGLILFVSLFVMTTPVTSEWLLVFGFPYPFQALDYFPIFPWIAIPTLGVFVGSKLYRSYERTYSVPESLLNSSLSKGLALLGAHSLLIYMAHAPILIALIKLF